MTQYDTITAHRSAAPRLPEDVKEAWIKALLSGKYPQGDGALSRMSPDGSERKYCCLGVLCRVMQSMDKVRLNIQEHGTSRESDRYDESGAFLPHAVHNVLGVTHNPAVRITDEAWPFIRAAATFSPNMLDDERSSDRSTPAGSIQLSVLNDHGVPFPVIAEVIRQYM